MRFEEKAFIVSEAWMVVRKNKEWDQVIEYGDIGFPLAYSVTNDLATIQDDGKKYIEEIYSVLLDILQIPDEHYRGFEAMLDKNIELFSENEESEKEG